MNNNPIGVFDSGVGGLSCVPALREALPNERIMYFGDTANAPYGTRSVEEIIELSCAVAEKLIGMGCKSLSVACNTISCTAVPSMQARWPEIPIIGIVDPAAKDVAMQYPGKNIGIIATQATINSHAYKSGIEAQNQGCRVFELAASEFVPVIEAGKGGLPETDAFVRNVLNDFIRSNGIEVLVLGCTHFPFIEKNIRRCYPELTVFNPAVSLAAATGLQLQEKQLCSDAKDGADSFLCSKETEAFKNISGDL